MRQRWLIVGLLVVTAGCGARGPAADAPEPALRGQTFTAGEVTIDGKPHTLVEGTELTVEFTDDGRLIAGAGCNMMQAPVDTADGRLAVGGVDRGLQMTGMGCDKPRHDQDDLIAEVLGATPTWRLSGSELEITSGATTLTFTEQSVAEPDLPLEDTVWLLDTMVDGEVASSVPASVPPVRVTFDGSRVTASTGCNGAGGEYTVDGDTLTVTPGPTTMKACGGDIMLVEYAVQAVLTGDVRFTITADHLTLTHPSGRGIQLRAS
jgi:heat shock protein HslJ